MRVVFRKTANNELERKNEAIYLLIALLDAAEVWGESNFPWRERKALEALPPWDKTVVTATGCDDSGVIIRARFKIGCSWVTHGSRVSPVACDRKC